MLEPRQEGRPPQAPTVAAPAPYADRRRTFRRAEDRIAHQEKVLLARALDVLASDAAAEERLAGLLRLLGKTAGARRVAVIADGAERRAAVGLAADEDPADAEALAGWLDANAPRSRARRAAAAPAPISLIVGGGTIDEDSTVAGPGAPVGSPGDGASDGPARHYAMLPIPTAGDVALGFEFTRAADAARSPDDSVEASNVRSTSRRGSRETMLTVSAGSFARS